MLAHRAVRLALDGFNLKAGDVHLLEGDGL